MQEIRTGYRSRYLLELAQRVASGELDFSRWFQLDEDELYKEIVSIKGVGPYAAGNLMRLLGHYRHLALDSWCRPQYSKIYRNGRKVSDRTIARHYRKYGAVERAGLVARSDAGMVRGQFGTAVLRKGIQQPRRRETQRRWKGLLLHKFNSWKRMRPVLPSQRMALRLRGGFADLFRVMVFEEQNSPCHFGVCRYTPRWGCISVVSSSGISRFRFLRRMCRRLNVLAHPSDMSNLSSAALGR